MNSATWRTSRGTKLLGESEKLSLRESRVGKIPGIIFIESKYPRYLLEVNTFVQRGIIPMPEYLPR